MQHIKVLVKDIEDETPAEPNIYAKEELQFATMVILEKGTTSGDTSVSFRLTDAAGDSYFAQMTGNIFRTCFGAFKGADERFKNK